MSTLKDQITPGRIVAILTPTVIAPAAGALAVLAAKYGMSIDADQLQAVFITGATSALGIGALWLKGWQDYEKRVADGPSAGVSNDLRLEETMAPRSIAVAELADGNGSVDVADMQIEDADTLEEELEADGFDEDLDELDEDLDLSDDEELVAVGEE